MLVLLMGLSGHLLAAPFMPDKLRPALPNVFIVMSNLLLLYLAVGAIALLVSTMSDRRGRAMAVVFALVLFSFLLNFLAIYWEPTKPFAFLSVLEYYRPAQVMLSGNAPLGDLAMLFLVALTAWTAGGEVMARRSLCTV